MKKILSSFLTISFMFISCSKKEEINNAKKQSIDQISVIIGVGKVLPKNGILNLSINQSNQITELYKKLGDSVQKGELIFKMNAVQENFDVELAKVDLEATISKNKSNFYNYNIAQIKANELKQQFIISKKLYAQNAETKQKVFLDSIAYVQQIEVIKQLKQENLTNNELVSEKKIKYKSNLKNLEDLEFRASRSGVLLTFDVVVGEIIKANTVFGEIAQINDLVIEGEIDELYANQIKIGQEVDVLAVGQNKIISKGKISFVGSNLQNKSIVYETIGEGSDRRVRRFTVTIPNKNNLLLINQKVECKIKI